MATKMLWRVSDIQRELGYGFYKSKRIFNAAKKIDSDVWLLRPFEVNPELCFKVLGLSPRQYKRHMEQNENE